MNFDKNFNIKKIVMHLLAIMLITYGVGALLMLVTGRNFVKVGNEKTKYSIDDSKTSSLDSINEISVDISSATINIIPGGTSDVKAHLYGDVISSSDYAKPELECYKSGNTLIIKRVTTPHMILGFFSSNVKLDVYIPSDYNKDVKLVNSSGNINVSGYKFNKLQCDLSSGSLNINDIKADTFNYSNSSGSLKADKLITKTTTLSSSSGSINITMFSGDLNSKSSSGSTRIQYSDFNNNIYMHSSSGRIQLQLPKSTQFSLDAAASSGDITCDFPITISGKKNNHKLQGIVGSDKNKIKLDVSSGDIEIKDEA